MSSIASSYSPSKHSYPKDTLVELQAWLLCSPSPSKWNSDSLNTLNGWALLTCAFRWSWMREQDMSSSTGRSANPCNLWQGFDDRRLVPKERATSTDSALESKALNPGLRHLKLLPGVWPRCKLPHEHKMRKLWMFKSHVCSLKETFPSAQHASSPQHRASGFRIWFPSALGRAGPCSCVRC